MRKRLRFRDPSPLFAAQDDVNNDVPRGSRARGALRVSRRVDRKHAVDPALARRGPMTYDPRDRRRKWSGREDSNLRPPAPKAGALPDCATPRRRQATGTSDTSFRTRGNLSRPLRLTAFRLVLEAAPIPTSASPRPTGRIRTSSRASAVAAHGNRPAPIYRS